MYMLDIGWWQAFVMDIGMTLFVLVYSVVFNWVYDHLRLRWVKSG
ncbi:Predicted membrane protein [Mannheimia haemolytica]|nr:Predicted membrane protein [Mannheimia haemolytica]